VQRYKKNASSTNLKCKKIVKIQLLTYNITTTKYQSKKGICTSATARLKMQAAASIDAGSCKGQRRQQKRPTQHAAKTDAARCVFMYAKPCTLLTE
jgi:hypothetical protein